ncbi:MULTISPECIES: SDR family NAD(P)-dependent oxidoreductase [Bradyrhizobium]|uniref:SDR family NAD(P)-dependent oxidoreductase n=1 Tax=Bradyrhizobium elkanii TaxID=29448 RepID=UPI001FD9C308|nr:SDR family NAD(P)-dependent oxidoreductase [Bradyrhizobium elkanii]
MGGIRSGLSGAGEIRHSLREEGMTKTWFITGAGRGLGEAFARAALARGDKVAATARHLSALQGLVDTHGEAVLPLILDVTDRTAAFEAVAKTRDKFGRLDVVVNNAGYGLFGAVEEITDQELRDQLEVNLFGALHVTQAALPILRAQGGGHIVQISTIGGVAAFPNLGGYHASKWALEGLTEALAQEVAAFGIKVTLVEPGPYATDWAGSSAVHAAPKPEYAELHSGMAQQASAMPAEFFGVAAAAGAALLKVVDSEAPPLRVFFGVMPTQLVPDLYRARVATWEQWKDLAVEAHGH